jgi:hypothetical protein
MGVTSSSPSNPRTPPSLSLSLRFSSRHSWTSEIPSYVLLSSLLAMPSGVRVSNPKSRRWDLRAAIHGVAEMHRQARAWNFLSLSLPPPSLLLTVSPCSRSLLHGVHGEPSSPSAPPPLGPLYHLPVSSLLFTCLPLSPMSLCPQSAKQILKVLK